MVAVLKPTFDQPIEKHFGTDIQELKTFPLARFYRWNPVGPMKYSRDQKGVQGLPPKDRIPPTRLAAVAYVARSEGLPEPRVVTPPTKWAEFFKRYDALPRNSKGVIIYGKFKALSVEFGIKYMTAMLKVRERRLAATEAQG